ncbi:MAG: hypothetical protein ACJAUR_000463 [Ulvibacter sp.]|jgi:hypothetical protein
MEFNLLNSGYKRGFWFGDWGVFESPGIGKFDGVGFSS